MIEIKLKSWKEFTAEKEKIDMRQYVECGIACPKCGEELLVDRMIVLTSYPPKRNYHCEKCKWHGTT